LTILSIRSRQFSDNLDNSVDPVPTILWQSWQFCRSGPDNSLTILTILSIRSRQFSDNLDNSVDPTILIFLSNEIIAKLCVNGTLHVPLPWSRSWGAKLFLCPDIVPGGGRLSCSPYLISFLGSYKLFLFSDLVPGELGCSTSLIYFLGS